MTVIFALPHDPAHHAGYSPGARRIWWRRPTRSVPAPPVAVQGSAAARHAHHHGRVNQTLMLALSMVVIASMIAVGGLGRMVLRGIGRVRYGTRSIGGLGICCWP